MSRAALRERIDGIVIGGSTGGIEALVTLLPALRPGLRAAVLVVLHVPPDRPSLLVEVFSRRCVLPVKEADDKEPISVGVVYLAPPGYHLLVDAGPAVALSVDEPVNYSRPSIDVLFESAANVYGRSLMAIVLSGASSDGTAGLAAVRDAGGVTVVQQPEEAVASLMLRSAMTRTTPDYLLSIEQIAELLQTLNASPLSGSHGQR